MPLNASYTPGLGSVLLGNLESCPVVLAFIFLYTSIFSVTCMSWSCSLCVIPPKNVHDPLLEVWVGVVWKAFGSMDRTGLRLGLVSS